MMDYTSPINNALATLDSDLYADRVIYLAVPYTSYAETPEARQQERDDRFKLITEVSGILIKYGIANFSPITQSHEQAKQVDLPTRWSFWRDVDLKFLKRMDEIWVVTERGWESSIGVQSEIAAALVLNIPVKLVQYSQKERLIVSIQNL